MAQGVCGYVCIILTLALVFFSTCQQTSAEIGYLLPKDNTVKESFRPRGAPSNGWRSTPISSGVDVYLICSSDDWLESVKGFNTSGIHELTVTIVFKYYVESSKKVLNRTSFFLAVVPTRGNPEESYRANGVMNEDMTNATSTELILVPNNNNKQNILIKPKDKKDCMMVFAVKITYKFCNKTTVLDVAEFPKTFAPRNGSAPQMVEGVCIIFGSKKPVAYCDSNGEWSFNETTQCSCAPSQIMTSTGCIELSSIIRNAKAFRLSSTRAVIQWEPTVGLKIHYKVICRRCYGQNCDQKCPDTVRSKENSANISSRNSSYISGLERGNDYLFIIRGRIDAIDQNYWNETSKHVQLRALPAEVKNLSIASYNHDRVVLTWFPPSNVDNTSVIYDVACRVHCLEDPCMIDRCKKLKFIPSRHQLLQTNVTITGFRNEGIQYVIEVRAKYSFYQSSQIDLGVEWNFAAINYTEDSKEAIPTDSKSFNMVDVVIGVSVLIFAVMFTIIATRFYNRWKRRKHSLSFDGENLEYPTHCEVSLTDITTHYIDPSNYDSVENVLRKFARKLSEKNLKTETIIGEGEFGVVWKGYLHIDGNERTVAVKCLRSGLSEKLRRDFLAEASVMGQFKDPNVISLHGVVVKKDTVKIVMEFMSNGSLNKYLEKNNGGLTILQLLGMARGIASGMNYLSGRNFIHRDLAARNILVDENLTCKVSDFGLTREICQTSNYEARGGKIPVRWTAPEVTKHGKSFIASDVWSYGVVLWEIMSFGQRPYWEWDNFRVLREIESGYRLPAPLKCPKTVHSLMLHCWDNERSERPTFEHILNKLDEWIRSPETIHHSPVTKARRHKMEEIECQSPIHEWLDAIKMGKYAPNFSEAGYNRLSQIVHLTEQDLIDIGITLVGHRHKIHQSIPLVT